MTGDARATTFVTEAAVPVMGDLLEPGQWQDAWEPPLPTSLEDVKDLTTGSWDSTSQGSSADGTITFRQLLARQR